MTFCLPNSLICQVFSRCCTRSARQWIQEISTQVSARCQRSKQRRTLILRQLELAGLQLVFKGRSDPSASNCNFPIVPLCNSDPDLALKKKLIPSRSTLSRLSFIYFCNTRPSVRCPVGLEFASRRRCPSRSEPPMATFSTLETAVGWSRR
jgi:hypothetical protein